MGENLFIIRVMLNNVSEPLIKHTKKENKVNSEKITFYNFEALNAQFTKKNLINKLN
jgi:hypothetical protein